MATNPAADPAVAAIIEQAVGQAVAEVTGQLGGVFALQDLLWRAKSYLAASITLLGWDILVTLNAEYKLFWKPGKITLVGVAFSFMRYWALFTMAWFMALFYKVWSPEACEHAHWLAPVPGMILISVTQFLVGARVHAIWERSKVVLFICLSCWAAGVALQIWSIYPNTFLRLPVIPGFPAIPGCIDTAVEKNADTFWVFWLSPLIFDSVAVLLTLVKVAQYYRSGDSLPRLLSIILRDGLAFFTAMMAINILNAVWFKTRKNGDHAIHGGMSLCLSVVLVSRMYINLRQASSSNKSTINSINTSGSYPLSDRSEQPSNRSVQTQNSSSPLVKFPNGSRTTLNEKRTRTEDSRNSFDFPV